LITVKSGDTAFFPKLPLDHHHLVTGDFLDTVDAADKSLFLGLVILRGVVHQVPETLQIILTICSFIGVGGIVHHPAQITLDFPYRRGSHLPVLDFLRGGHGFLERQNF